VCVAAGCTASERTSSTTAGDVSTGTSPDAPTVESAGPGFATLPPVDQFTYPTGPDDIVVQISIDAPTGPDVPLLTVYGDGAVVAATNDGWRIGRISDLAVQALLDDAKSVGLLDEPLNLRGPEPPPSVDAAGTSVEPDDSPDISVRFAVDGRTLLHELDLSRIERPPGIRVFLNAAAVENRFDLTAPFDPTAWISCTTEQCEIVAAQQDPTSRPVLPHEDATGLLAP
jgi:hypothetical protein